jgi:hypothetical protein
MFEVTGSDASHLTAADFALSPSSIPPGDKTGTGVFKFQSGGIGGDGSAFIGTTASCLPGLWYARQPRIGNIVKFVIGLDKDCHGCLLLSKDPTPFSLFGLLEIPLSPPYQTVWSGLTTVAAQIFPITIPADPALVGFEGYLTLLTVDESIPGLDGVLFSPVVPFTIIE